MVHLIQGSHQFVNIVIFGETQVHYLWPQEIKSRLIKIADGVN